MRRLATLVLSAAVVLGAAAAPVSAARSEPSIVDVAISVNVQTGEFDELIAAVSRAGLVDALSKNRQLTVFAPTDAAFENLYAALGVTGVDEIPLDTLTAVLLYHVAPGRRDSGDVLGSTRIRTLNGAFATPSVQGGLPYIDGARIVIPDVFAGNGVIHVIDAVILPS